MLHTLDILSSTLASSLCQWRGTSASKTIQPPKKELVLFDREGDHQCRMVREMLTLLNLDAIIMPCPEGGKRHLKALQDVSGASDVPFLHDRNTGEKLSGAQAINAYLWQQYKGSPLPASLQPGKAAHLASQLASEVRLKAGMKARANKRAAKRLTLYSFESSPFSRPVRERLCELEIAYKLINLGKQQWPDMGPAKLRPSLKAYKPLPGTKRDAFFQEHGNVQVPYLIDPNTDTALFESKDILDYLERTYGAS